jgi:hypothetical protein
MAVGQGLSDPKLQAVIAEVQAISPQPADRWEIAAILESLGYTDRHIREEFNYSDSLNLGSEIYEYLRDNGYLHPLATLLPPMNQRQPWIVELMVFGQRFGRSFLYAVPFLASVLFDILAPRQDHPILPLQLSALLTPAIMASLITSGGFVQMIQRRGAFYQHMNEPLQVQRSCRPIFVMGVVASLLLGLLGVVFGFYRSYAGDNYVILTAFYYVVLCILWLTFAMVALRHAWSTPVALLGISAVYLICRQGWGLDAVSCQLITMTLALVGMLGWLARVYWEARRTERQAIELPPLPTTAAVAYLLTPYFLYGLAYFSFLFADRFAAGWVLEKYSSLAFAVDSRYQRPMDLALLVFLVLMPFAEYFGDRFCHWWYRHAQKTPPSQMGQLGRQLQRRYRLFSSLLLSLGLILGGMTLLVMAFTSQPLGAISLTAFGALGYTIMALGFWNAIILLVLNQIVVVLKMIGPAIVVNIVCGYIFGNIWGIAWVPIGLVIGSGVFAGLASRQVQRAMDQADFCYYYSGY